MANVSNVLGVSGVLGDGASAAMGSMSQPVEDPESAEPPAEHLLSDDPALNEAIWESLDSDITSEDF